MLVREGLQASHVSEILKKINHILFSTSLVSYFLQDILGIGDRSKASWAAGTSQSLGYMPTYH